MAVRRQRRGGLLRVLISAAIGVSVMAFVLGYTMGTSQHLNSFSDNQIDFMEGVVQGTEFRLDFEEWNEDPKHDPEDPAQEPEARCAGDFYPDRPLAMSGCIQGLTDPPGDGYRLPPVPVTPS